MHVSGIQNEFKKWQTELNPRQNHINFDVKKRQISSTPSLCTATADLKETSVFTDRTKGPLDR